MKRHRVHPLCNQNNTRYREKLPDKRAELVAFHASAEFEDTGHLCIDIVPPQMGYTDRPLRVVRVVRRRPVEVDIGQYHRHIQCGRRFKYWLVASDPSVLHTCIRCSGRSVQKAFGSVVRRRRRQPCCFALRGWFQRFWQPAMVLSGSNARHFHQKHRIETEFRAIDLYFGAAYCLEPL